MFLAAQNKDSRYGEVVALAEAVHCQRPVRLPGEGQFHLDAKQSKRPKFKAIELELRSLERVLEVHAVDESLSCTREQRWHSGDPATWILRHRHALFSFSS